MSYRFSSRALAPLAPAAMSGASAAVMAAVAMATGAAAVVAAVAVAAHFLSPATTLFLTAARLLGLSLLALAAGELALEAALARLQDADLAAQVMVLGDYSFAAAVLLIRAALASRFSNIAIVFFAPPKSSKVRVPMVCTSFS